MKLPNSSDIELWTKFKNDDNEALSLIYIKNAPKLYRYGLKFTPNHSIIEDAIQDLFTGLVRGKKSIGHTDNIQFYLIKSFKRLLKRELMKEHRYILQGKDRECPFEITYSIEQTIILQESSNHRINLLRTALNNLTPRQKEAIYLRFTLGLEYKEIADMMDVGIEGCRNLIYKAVKSLKDSLQGSKSFILFHLHKLF